MPHAGYVRCLLAVLAVIVLDAEVRAFEGPLAVRNQFPLFLIADAPYFESAALPRDVTMRMSYSSIFMTRDSSEWTVNLDMEMAELALTVRTMLGTRIAIGAEVPVLIFTDGFLDGFLNSYHDTFGFSDYGRPSRPDNEFLFEVTRSGKTVIRGDIGPGLGDIRLFVQGLLREANPTVSVRVDVEFPTGDAKKGFGNGSLDGGVALLVDQPLSERISLYGMGGAVLAGDLKAYERINMENYLYGGAALQYKLTQGLRAVGQLFVQSSPFPETGIGEVDDTAFLLSLGLTYLKGKTHFAFAFTEDLSHSGAPDFTVSFVVKTPF
jgi:hypothetical protein